MRFREVFLLAVLLVAGLVVYQVQTGHWDLRFDWEDDIIGIGREFSYEETQVFEAPLPAELRVVNAHGWVEVRGDDQESVRLTFKKRIWRRKEEEAKDIAGRLRLVVDRTPEWISLSTNRLDFRKRNFETGFVLTVPRRMALAVENSYGPVRLDAVGSADVRNRHGELYVSDIDGTCVLETSYEDLEARNVRADCRIVNRHADVRASSVTGDVRVEFSYGLVRLEDIGRKAEISAQHAEIDARRVQGPVSVETSYEKVTLLDVGPAVVRARHSSVTADGVRGDLDIETSYEPVRATKIDGNFVLSGRSVEVSAAGIGGQDISINSSYENVSLAGFSARLRVGLRHGDLVLKPTDLKFPMEIRNEYSAISLFWPPGEASPLEALSRGGSVDWGLPEKPSLQQSNGDSLVKAFSENAGRPLVSLSTSHGDIRIQLGGRDL